MSPRAIPTEIPLDICRSAWPVHKATGPCDDLYGLLPVLKARANGESVTRGKRRELLAQLAAGEVVELEIDFTAFQQVEGEANANFLRFKPGVLRKFARSFVGMPLLKDHDQHALDSRAGTITASKAESIEGGLEFQMTANVTAPFAVAAILRGNLDRFSIGWAPGTMDTILCSIDKAPIFTVCSHFPGDLAVDEDGNELGRVEFIFTEVSGTEVSGVNVPAVVGTGIDEIRSALSAVMPGTAHTTKTLQGTHPPAQPEVERMDKLAISLGLPADADLATILAAVEANKAAAAASTAAAGQAAEQLAELGDKVAVIKARETSARIDKLFADNANRLPPARDAAGNAVASECEVRLRTYAAGNFDQAAALLASMPPQTPAGAPPVVVPLPTQPGAPAGNAILDSQLKQLGISAADFAKFNPINGTELDGVDDPQSMKPRHYDA